MNISGEAFTQEISILQELGHTMRVLVLFLVIAVALALFLFFVLGVDGEPRRKFLHVISFSITPVMAAAATHWYVVAAADLLFALVVYPILCLFERLPFYKNLFQERAHGEVKKSLLLLFITEAYMVAVFWGVLDSRSTVIAAILVWGFGDAAAALIGKRFGRHKIGWRIADNKKSYEGSGAMVLVDVLILMIIQSVYIYEVSVLTALLVAVITAFCAAFAELISKHGNDTVTVQVTAAITLYLLQHIFL